MYQYYTYSWHRVQLTLVVRPVRVEHGECRREIVDKGLEARVDRLDISVLRLALQPLKVLRDLIVVRIVDN